MPSGLSQGKGIIEKTIKNKKHQSWTQSKSQTPQPHLTRGSSTSKTLNYFRGNYTTLSRLSNPVLSKSVMFQF
jgi:hypothetical protein